MNTKERKEYQRKWARERRQAAKGVDKVVESVDKPSVDVPVVDKLEREWDKECFPVREAWEIAVARVERARKYARMFPDRIGPSDYCFQDVFWQYEHEGLPAVGKKAA